MHFLPSFFSLLQLLSSGHIPKDNKCNVTITGDHWSSNSLNVKWEALQIPNCVNETFTILLASNSSNSSTMYMEGGIAGNSYKIPNLKPLKYVICVHQKYNTNVTQPKLDSSTSPTTSISNDTNKGNQTENKDLPSFCRLTTSSSNSLNNVNYLITVICITSVFLRSFV